jgi:hypothetical protein
MLRNAKLLSKKGMQKYLAGCVINFFPLVVSDIQTAHHRLQSLQESAVYGLASTPDQIKQFLFEHVGFLIVLLFAYVY